MTQTLLDLSPATATERVAELFKARPSEWLSAMDIVKAGGLLSWRTRVSELRRAPYLMVIENRTERYGRTKYSFYRWVA